MTFQSLRFSTRSEPINPPKGMNGTPFSDACKAVWMAGQVVSRTGNAPVSTATVKRGAGPASPRLTAAASRLATAPAPINKSVAMPPIGTASIFNSLMPPRIMARTRAMGTQL